MEQRKYDVITIGETTVDAFMTIFDSEGKYRIDNEHHDFCIRPGQKIDVDQYDFFTGGNATNVAVGLSRLGLKAGLCSEIGDDELSIKIRNSLARENVERLLVKQVPGATSFSVIINFQGDRTIFNQNVRREHDFDFSEVTTPFVYLTSMGEEWEAPYKKVLEFVEANSSTLAFNPGSRQVRGDKEIVRQILQKTSYLFVNKDEAELLLFDKETNQNDKEYVNDLLNKLQELGPKTVVITDGIQGSYAKDEQGELYWHSAGDGKIVERTGAGDAYSTGFIAAKLYGSTIEKAMEWGSNNATSVVSKIGAQAGLLTKEEMEEAVHEDETPHEADEKASETFEVLPAPVE
jgi:sugar/nucleoside kinase (ribokinase family)